MNALRWIAGFFGYFAVLTVMYAIAVGVGYPLAIANTFVTDLTGIDFFRVVCIALCFLVPGGIVIGEILSRYR